MGGAGGGFFLAATQRTQRLAEVFLLSDVRSPVSDVVFCVPLAGRDSPLRSLILTFIVRGAREQRGLVRISS